MSRPYIGVTGFMAYEQVEQALQAIPEKSSHDLMIGVLASSKTLSGIANRWPGRYPHICDIEHIFNDDPRALNLIHYSTDERVTLLEQLQQLTELGGPYLDGFQLNICWPEISILREYVSEHPEMFIVLQVGTRAMAKCQSFDDFHKKIETYLPFISAVLIDPSGGLGKYLDSIDCSSYLASIADLPVGLGVAGGLGPYTLGLLDPIIMDISEPLSIDAEGQLRTPKPEDALDLDKVKGYLTGSFQKLARIPS
jgi:hypothetical protein